jgi:SAM-dependent methyltransferase
MTSTLQGHMRTLSRECERSSLVRESSKCGRVRNVEAVSAKTPWGAVDPRRLATALEPVSRLVVERADVRPGDRVLDVGCGTGNAALLAAERGCIVSAVDYEPRSLEIARARATEQDLKVSLRKADAVALPYSDASFSTVTSVFGAMYASDQERAAHELGRVCTPGGSVVLAAWAPMSFYSLMGIVLADYLTTPPPTTSPVLPAHHRPQHHALDRRGSPPVVREPSSSRFRGACSQSL